MSFLEKIFPDGNKKELKKMQPIVEAVNALEAEYEKLSDEEIKNKTVEFKQKLKEGKKLDDILPEAFATVREAAKRTLGMRHYDVQIIGAVALHKGKIAEMRTGEGKTLTSTLPVYLNALEGKGVHVVTVNDYLAKRDAVWMAKIYDFLGLSVGVIQNQRVSFVYDSSVVRPEEISAEEIELESFKVENEFLRPSSRKDAYACDITYGTNNEYGFDYLRDNMVQTIEEMVMRPGHEMHYCIIDEIDSILIDEARTPLIISSAAEEATQQYYQFASWAKQLKENEDYNVDEKLRASTLTAVGITKFEKWLGVENLYVEGGISLVHHIEQALKAEVLFKRDKDYIVDNGEIIIIDEFTGRKMPGRRYSEGLHQAIEAKENVNIQRESRTLATITFQNLFRMYKKLSGMTGTAKTEEEEFYKIYALEVLVVPTNKSDARTDFPDRIYRTENGKNKAIVEKVKECQQKGQPVLIGTISVEKNEVLSQYLTINGIQHEILNAKNHEREGEIIAQAGRPSAVTLATNMAGRGVDIKLGGVPFDNVNFEKIRNAGGLFVLGTERHESRRIDNQLRGRSARQGDPGETQFFVSTEDDLMRIFAGDRLKNVMTRFNVPEDMPIEQKFITKMLEGAQKKVESHHFDTRKHLLEYDDVLNKQRSVIYKKRRHVLNLSEKEMKGIVLEAKVVENEKNVNEEFVLENNVEVKVEKEQSLSLHDMIMEMIESEIEFIVSFHTNTEDDTQWNVEEVYETVKTIFPLTPEDKKTILDFGKDTGDQNISEVERRDKLVEFLLAKARHEYGEMIKNIQDQIATDENKNNIIVELQKSVLIRTIDNLWVDYLVAIDYLRTGIGLRGYGQRDPLVEYKQESFHLFNQLLANIQKEVVYTFFKINIGLQLAPSIMATDKMTLKGAEKTTNAEAGIVEGKVLDEEGHKVGRNDPCPCGATKSDGTPKKYKHCHGK
ncbi:MAG: preprotein translocase subunit SecA [Patescibacteria group bacterium]|nr:preprotein translocase subunit SecA [Patescibacteria group bacterium]